MNTAKLKAVPRHSVDGYGRQDISYNDPEGEFVFYSDYEALKDALEAAHKRIAELTDALRQAVSGYKSCLRTGHERIIELGGECDAPETMIAGNPDIRQAEKVLAVGINLETGGE
ncbi:MULTISPECIES: ead/Ea22-like family protein [Cronobacter]|uniref:ead/Ea22-like family protein n=1 Tax=Cronobacter TaxID=413496 RepID=UPI001AA0EB3E|nr:MULTISPECIES: ead/Ea22-like family protein [Cronobacter]ELY3599419.1 ead/Ea22-like family protein [Cronobacter sakazakii]EMC4369451.1 ead/Ea22-like family protein [Cronobacter sakazakii]EMD9402576.1 ead/Ea22-like family protein [Cronobacter malonaticus]EMD9419807.1 ead/Ea22-like family protein [Cronobacter malonaticus]